MNNIIKNKNDLMEIKKYPLSNFDIQEVLNNVSHPNTNIINYEELNNIYHIDEIFDNLGRCIILIPTESLNSGHWVALIKKNNEIEFFDPYGKTLKQQEKNLNSNIDIDEDIIIKLCKRDGYKLSYSNKKNQPYSSNIATCGRHSVMRVILYKLSNDEYNKMMEKLSKLYNVSSDDIVSIFTTEILKK